MDELIVPLRIRVLRPPPGVQWCLQKGSSEPVSAAIGAANKDLTFDCEVRAQPDGTGGVRFLGPFTQGPPKARFVYLCSGTSAGQHGSVWTRRAKIQLGSITWDMVHEASAKKKKLVTEFEGTAKDGGPSCATVKLTTGWHVS
jgi:hypothetical protein